MLLTHGGNIKKISSSSKIPRNEIIDFSSNINPLGISPEIRKTINENINRLTEYPDPECIAARQALAGYFNVDNDNILIANGSNEIIHLIPPALRCASALIYKPAFCEYEAAIKLSGAQVYSLFANDKDNFSIDIGKILSLVSKVKLVFLCNPNNPTGFFIKQDALLSLLKACEKTKTYLLLDEVFIEFTESGNKASLINKISKYRYLIVLRSLTKFFSIPGLRAGYVAAHRDVIRKIAIFQPTWSVNSFVQEIIPHCLKNTRFINASQSFMNKERGFLFNRLREINGIYPYAPAANFIFCKILDKRLTADILFSRLLKSRILIRTCADFDGLNEKFFRVAVKKRKDNQLLIQSLRKAFSWPH